MPFEDNHADQVAAIHVIEHFYLWDVPEILREWKRVLKPAGQLILELPCMDKVIYYMKACLDQQREMDAQMTWLAIWGDPNYKRVEMCHKWGYTKAQMVELLKDAGFTDVQVQKPRYHVVHRDMRVVAVKPLTT